MSRNNRREATDEQNGTNSVTGRFSRRDVLKTGALATLATPAILSRPATAATVYLEDEGLNDGDLIDPYLQNHFVSGNTVYIPTGDFQYEGDGLGGSYSDAELIGDGPPDGVQLHYPSGIGRRYDAIDATSGTVRLENITFRGEQEGIEGKLRAEATGSNATMVLERIWQPDGVPGSEDAVGFYVGADHAGTVEFIDCYAEDFNDNGLYASAPGSPTNSDAEGGQVIVEGGLYKNNNISGVRLGSDDSQAYQVTIVNDDLSPANDGVNNQRGFRIRQPGDNIVFDDCDVYQAVDSWHPFAFYDIDGGTGTIKNTRFYTESSSDCIEHDFGASYSAENLDLTGSGDHTVGTDSTSGICDSQDGDDCTVAANRPRSRTYSYLGRNDADPNDVDEDFSHDDVAGNYTFDSQSFTESSARSTSGSYSITPDDDADGDQFVVRTDMEMQSGNTYDVDVYFPSSSGNDMGLLFGAQDGGTGWDEYTGYLGLFDFGDGEVRLDRKDDGSTAASNSTSSSWPTDEWLTVEIDYRDSDSSTITVAVSDASDSQVASVSLGDTEHDSGLIGFYNWHSTSDWHADSWSNVDQSSPTTDEVAEDFSHDDVPGAYSIDTGSFTTSSTRATSDDFSLRIDDDADGNRIILRDDVETRSGNTYELDVYHQSSSGADMGFLFSAQDGITGWGDYTGYLGFFDSAGDEIRLKRFDSGSEASSSITSTTWPLDQWSTVELDYRDTDSSTITMTVYDHGSEVASVSLGDITHDSGGVGFYNWHASSDWHADTWFNARESITVESFGHDDVAGTYSLDTGSFTTTSTRSTTDDYSLTADDGSDGNSAIVRNDRLARAGEVYELDVYFPSASGNDLGVLIGAQDGTSSWSDYSGYLAFFESDDDEIRVDRKDGGSTAATSSSQVNWPTDEWLTVELDYRGTDANTITMTLYDAAGSHVGSVSLGDTTYDSGGIGFYNWHASSDWHADSWFDV